MASEPQHRDQAARFVQLRETLLAMAGRVEEMIAAASWVVFTRDLAGAREVEMLDAGVDAAEVEIDELCRQILAEGHPVGHELRFVTSAIKMVTDLERIGDLAVGLAHRARDLAELARISMHPGIEKMSEIARRMVSAAIDAFVDGDVAAARRVIEMDDEIDALYREVRGAILALMVAEPAQIGAGIHLQSVATLLERIGDHATNLAEQVVFMVEGRDIRHGGGTSPPAS